ncbi:hypothetical protein BDR26DRAFT_849073, partial [Obelidium mucronatum]
MASKIDAATRDLKHQPTGQSFSSLGTPLSTLKIRKPRQPRRQSYSFNANELISLLDQFAEQEKHDQKAFSVEEDVSEISSSADNSLSEVESISAATPATPAVTTAAQRRRQKKQKQIAREKKVNNKSLDEFLLQEYGCPTAAMGSHMNEVAQGLGRPAKFSFFNGYAFASWKEGNTGYGRTHLFGTWSGLDSYKLQLCDELARHVASYSQSESAVLSSNASLYAPSLRDPLEKLPWIQAISMYLGGTLKSENRSKELAPNTTESEIKNRILHLASVAQLKSNEKKPWMKHVQIFTSIAVSDALQRLKLIRAADPLYPEWLSLLIYGIKSAWISLSALTVAFCCRFMVVLDFPICPGSTTVSSIIQLVQGTNITLSIMELASRHPGAGVSRLGYSLTVTALIGIGLEFGDVLALSLTKASNNVDLLVISACPHALSTTIQWAIFVPTIIIFIIDLNAHPRQFFFMALVLTVAQVIYTLVYPTLGDPLSSFITAFTMGTLSNVYSQVTLSNPIVAILAGLQVLVPGTLAVRAFSSADVASGISLAGSVLVIALSLGLGLFLGSVVGGAVSGILKHRKWVDRNRVLYL